MRIVATFNSVDDDGNDFKIGTVTWNGEKAVPEPVNAHYLQRVAKSVNEYHDPEAAMRELPSLCNSAYLRAAISG